MPILALTVTTGVLSLVNFTWPVWTPARSVARIAINAASSVIFFVLMRSQAWLIAKEGATFEDGTLAQRIVEVANKSVEIGLVVALIISLIEIARETVPLAVAAQGLVGVQFRRGAHGAVAPRRGRQDGGRRNGTKLNTEARRHGDQRESELRSGALFYAAARGDSNGVPCSSVNTPVALAVLRCCKLVPLSSSV